jgi:uncharacterized protein
VSTIEFLLLLRSLNVRVWLEDGELRHSGTAGLPTGGLREEFATRQAEIAGYLSEADDCEHSTQYIEMRDGVMLAADIFRPKQAGRIVAGCLPVLWCQDRYLRSSFQDGVIATKLDTRPWLRAVMRHGYVIAVVDARGTGASTGVRHSEFGAAETQDCYEVTEWLAGQHWCSGRVGMFGDSYLAVAQLLAAGTAPPHLRAIFPQMPLFDLYSFLYPGGVLRRDFVEHWAERVTALDTGDGAVPVAGQAGLAASAARQHERNYDIVARALDYPYRDSPAPDGDESPYRRSPSAFADAITASQVAVYLLSGWYDMWVRDALLWFANLGTPRRLIIGPSAHTGREQIDLAAEHLRWFDYWLKDIDTGVMADPPIRYWTINAQRGTEWRNTAKWPPSGTRPVRLYFQGGPSGSCASSNDGSLAIKPPDSPDGADDYEVDYSTSSGRATRWVNGYGGEFGYQPLTSNDGKALTYTTARLSQDCEATGHPIGHLYITSTYPDGDFFVYLEDVDEKGESCYVTEGVIRASCRAPAEPPYENLGLPYHACTAAGQQDLPSIPAELAVDLHPTSWVFRAGHRIRVTVTGADRDNASTPVRQPAPIVTVYRQAGFASYLDLPLTGVLRTAGEG